MGLYITLLFPSPVRLAFLKTVYLNCAVQLQIDFLLVIKYKDDDNDNRIHVAVKSMNFKTVVNTLEKFKHDRN